MSRNLLKMGRMNAPASQKRIIDTNSLIAERIGSLKDEMVQPENDGFTEGLQMHEADVSALICDPQTDASDQVHTDRTSEQDAESRAKEILQEAQDAAGRILREAIDQGEQEAQKLKDQAREEGYQEGMAKAGEEEKRRTMELDERERQLEDRARQMEEEYQAILEELEPKFIDTLSGIYEHLFHVDLAGYRDVLISLIRDCLSGTENGKTFQIHVSKEDYTYVNTKKPLLLEAAGTGDVTMEIIEDPTLQRNDCVIRTEYGIMDCGLGTQLDELTKRLKLLAYEKK